MAKTWKLIKIMVKMQFSLAGKKTSEKVGIGFALLVGIPFVLFILYLLNGIIGSLYNLLAPTGNENVILGLLFLLMTFAYLLISFTTILSSFYFAEDVESFIALPLEPVQIIMGKSAVPFLSLYGTNAVILLPSLLMYGGHSNAGMVYYIFALIVWLLIPVVPFVFSAILLMFFMRFANIAKNKDRTKVIAGIFSFLLIIGFNIVIRLNISTAETSSGLADFIKEKNGLLDLLTASFPNAYWGSMALTETSSYSGILYLLLFIALSFIGLALFMTVGQKLYFKGVLGLSGGRKQVINEDQMTSKIKSRTLVMAAYSKEMKVIFRTPTFFTQIVVQTLLFPFLLIVIFMMDSSGSFSSIGSTLQNGHGKALLLTLIGFIVFIFGVNPAAISSVSRDGKSWFNHLYLPIPAKTVMLSKLMSAFTMNVFTLILIGLATLFFFHVLLGIWTMWIILSLLIGWFTSSVGTILDLSNPKLNWTDEREVFKGRVIGLAAMAVQAAVFGISILILWNVDAIRGAGTTAAILFLLLLTACLVSHFILKRMINAKYYSIL
ncbi:ABC transporter permease [Halobacillus rhizosphaerae]|uniref:putative ABC transporter permease subunit n=1 Tax=Halobacillus rhizosphaerae TaxID=3064889 RepID=UPI00398BA993